MLSFELKMVGSGEVAEEMEVFFDAVGLESLLTQLNFLKKGQTEHIHLMSESWGGTHLDNQPQQLANTTIKHVKFLLR
jgi:hypothetical protein